MRSFYEKKTSDAVRFVYLIQCSEGAASVHVLIVIRLTFILCIEVFLTFAQSERTRAVEREYLRVQPASSLIQHLIGVTVERAHLLVQGQVREEAEMRRQFHPNRHLATTLSRSEIAATKHTINVPNLLFGLCLLVCDTTLAVSMLSLLLASYKGAGL